jgi:hypothetical protein
MTSIREAIRRLILPGQTHQPLPAGTYHYQAPANAERPYRLHLRLEPGGNGVLIVNASTVLHLNRTAAEFAYYLVQGTPKDTAIQAIADRYRIKYSRARQDYEDFVHRLQSLTQTTDLDPVSYLDFDRYAPYSQEISAPYRLDCALTYQLPEGINPEAAPTKRVDRELTTAEWKSILDKAWDAGIPHVVFTGGEPTLRPDLAELIAYTESKGLVSGLLTDGLKLADPTYLNELLQTGLDHLMFNLQPDNPAAWAALTNQLAADIFVAVHMTLNPGNAARASMFIERLAQTGIKAISLSATTPDLNDTLATLRDFSAEKGLSLVWDLPVPYSAFNPVALEVSGDAISEGAGRAWLYVEPDGDVLPAQGINKVLGNFLRDPWEQIWKTSGT